MKPLIVFYSRSGKTRALARSLATRLNAELAEIKCPRYEGGALRYLLAGYDSLRLNLPSIEVPQIARTANDPVLVGGPIWTSYPATPLRRYLIDYGHRHRNAAFFLTYGGQSPPEKAFAEMSALMSSPALSTLAVKNASASSPKSVEAQEAFCRKLEAAWSTLHS